MDFSPGSSIAKTRLSVATDPERGAVLRLAAFGDATTEIDLCDDAPALAAALLATWSEVAAKAVAAERQESLRAIFRVAIAAIHLAEAAGRHGAAAPAEVVSRAGDLASAIVGAIEPMRWALADDAPACVADVIDTIALQKTTGD